jgi:hypothetical protein
MSSICVDSSLHCASNDGYAITPSSVVPELQPIESSPSLFTTLAEYPSHVSSIGHSHSYSIDMLLSLHYTTRITRGTRRAIFALRLWKPVSHIPSQPLALISVREYPGKRADQNLISI